MKYTYLFFLWLFFTGLFVSCQEDDLNSTSIFDDGLETEKNALDIWIEKNYLYPYNLDFKYRMEDIESSLSNNLVPIDYDLAIQMARIVKHVWFEAYDEIGGISFTRMYVSEGDSSHRFKAVESQWDYYFGICRRRTESYARRWQLARSH